MCSAEGTLVYGLTVRSADLVFAADAWTRLQHSFHFFDLVFLRRRNGGLTTKRGVPDGPVTKLPNEVWEEIRSWVIKEEIADSEDNLLGALLCDNPTCQVRPSPSKLMSWERIRQQLYNECDYCNDAFQDYLRESIENWEEPIACRIVNFLSAFGLYAPSHSAVLTKTTWDDSPEVSALALIGAPSTFSKGDSADTLASAECGHDNGPDEHTIVDVSFDGLPTDIDHRFERLIDLFDLEVVSSSINKISPRICKLDETKKSGSTHGVKDKTTKKIKPGWKMYLLCRTNW